MPSLCAVWTTAAIWCPLLLTNALSTAITALTGNNNDNSSFHTGNILVLVLHLHLDHHHHHHHRPYTARVVLVSFVVSYCCALNLLFLLSLSQRNLGVGVEHNMGGEMEMAAERHLARAATHFSVGLKCYYFAIPFGLWFISPVFMVLAMCLMVIFIWKTDL